MAVAGGLDRACNRPGPVAVEGLMHDRGRPTRFLVPLLIVSVVAGCASGSAPDPTTLPSPRAPSGTLPVVADRYPDGIPRTLGGQLVIRGSAALAAARTATDTTEFLVGGWVTYWAGPMSCPMELAGDTSWLHECGRPAFSDRAGGEDDALSAATEFRFVLGSLATGPVVVSVALHDPRASSCGPARPACDRLMVVQAILWAGDGATDAAPLSAAAVEAVLARVQPVSTFGPLPREGLLTDCGDRLPAAALYTPLVYPTRTPAVTLVEIEPSVAARARALGLPDGLSGAVAPAAVLCTMVSTSPSASSSAGFRWLTLANVALLVRTHLGLTAEDRSFLASVAEGLAAIAR